MPNKIRVGIVGASVTQGGSGWGQNAHVPALKALPGYELKAVCTAHEDTAKASAAAFGADRAFHRFSDMAAHPEIDLIAVCVRVPGHRELVMAGLQAGKPVHAGHAEVEQDEIELLHGSHGLQHLLQGAGMVNADVGVEFPELSFEQLTNQRVIVCDDHVQRWSAGHGFIVPLDIVPTQAIMGSAPWAIARTSVTNSIRCYFAKAWDRRGIQRPRSHGKKARVMDRSQSGED